MLLRLLLPTIFLLSIFPILQAQTSAYEDYIRHYASMAVDQMKRYRIPASITLAQGLLESGAGRSALATKANNHFGIKAGRNWTGPYVLCNDDAPNERFRAYSSVRESYEDHSLFLANGRRYSRLFTLSPRDYKGWAHGLKEAGYATNPRYAHLLIELIERYALHRYDSGKKAPHNVYTTAQSVTVDDVTVHRLRDNFYIISRAGETYQSIARAMKMSHSRLCRYNEVPTDAKLQPGSIVFFKKKKQKADKSLRGHRHTVQPGESIHSISQQYGMRMKTIYKLNDLPYDYVPTIGEKLIIR